MARLLMCTHLLLLGSSVMTEAVYNNNASQPPHQKGQGQPPAGQSGQRSQDSWCQPDVSGYSDRSINETDFLGDVDYEWLCG